MTRQLVTIEVDGTIFAIRGWKAHGLALGAGLRPTFSGVRQAWVADTRRLPDLVAYLERRNVGYEVAGAEAQVGDLRLDVATPDIKDQLDLFGGAL